MTEKILFVLTPALNPNAGGVQQATYKLGKYLTEHGYNISYYSFAQEGHKKCEYGTLFHSLKPGGAEERQNLNYLEDVCAEVRPDVVINQMPYEYDLTDLLGKLKSSENFTLIGCLHNSLFSVINNLEESMKLFLPDRIFPLFDNFFGRKIAFERHRYLHKKSLKHILSNHDRYILLTPSNNKELKYFVGDFMQEKVLSIPNSIKRQAPNTATKRKIILHVGRLTITQKRSDLLLPFWLACKDQLTDWEFVVVGDGPHKSVMENQIKSQNIDRVTLAGFQIPDKYYESASIFMMPSAYEGFPFTILESQSYGCPVLAFNSYEALNWIVNDGADAFIAEPFDVKKMANQAVFLAENDQMRKKAQKAAIVNAQRFTTEKVGEQWEELFDVL